MSILRVRTPPGSTDRYGDPDVGTATETEIPGPLGYASAFTAPRTSSDINEPGRAGVIVGLSLYMAEGFDLKHSDHVKVDGTLYRVDGEPGNWPHPMTGWKPGSEVALVRAEG